jgi:hypothetical protein
VSVVVVLIEHYVLTPKNRRIILDSKQVILVEKKKKEAVDFVALPEEVTLFADGEYYHRKSEFCRAYQEVSPPEFVFLLKDDEKMLFELHGQREIFTHNEVRDAKDQYVVDEDNQIVDSKTGERVGLDYWLDYYRGFTSNDWAKFKETMMDTGKRVEEFRKEHDMFWYITKETTLVSFE